MCEDVIQLAKQRRKLEHREEEDQSIKPRKKKATAPTVKKNQERRPKQEHNMKAKAPIDRSNISRAKNPNHQDDREP